jgi:hypothetical protein
MAFATVAEFVAAVALAATTIGLTLALLDAIYGYQGIDILLPYSSSIPIVLPPTVERQNGEYWSYNNRDLSGRLSKGNSHSRAFTDAIGSLEDGLSR